MNYKRRLQGFMTLSLTFLLFLLPVSAQDFDDIAGNYHVENPSFEQQLSQFFQSEVNFLDPEGMSQLILSNQGELELVMPTADFDDDLPMSRIIFRTGLDETELSHQYTLNLDHYELVLVAPAQEFFDSLNEAIDDATVKVTSIEDFVNLMKLDIQLDQNKYSFQEAAFFL